MRHSGAGAGIFRWSNRAGLSATDGPPLPGVFRKIAHLAAACCGLSVCATAVATSHLRARNTCGFVCPSGKREHSGGEAEIQQDPDSNASEAFRGGGLHADTVSGRVEKKPLDRSARIWGLLMFWYFSRKKEVKRAERHFETRGRFWFGSERLWRG
jgi:hypothetical protein